MRAIVCFVLLPSMHFSLTCVENITWHSITNTFNASDLVSVGLETTREGDAGLNFSPGIASEH